MTDGGLFYSSLPGPQGPPGSDATVKLISNVAVKPAAVPVAKSAVVASGVAVFHFTVDGTPSGSPLWPNGPDTNSIQPIINDPIGMYLYGWSWSNSNKTLTVTVNKAISASLLNGAITVNPANGATCTVIAWGN